MRKIGTTYGEIRRRLNVPVPKSTLSVWFKSITSDPKYKKVIELAMKKNSGKGHIFALEANRVIRKKYLESIDNRIKHLEKIISNKNIAKISLAMLYLGEGAKNRKGSLMFGNSNPDIIKLFLHLLRHCYRIDEKKFRCTLQCRADQNIKKLEKFWSETTNIPLSQFYKARIDPRTIGKKSKKPEYKGVCRIDYFSADTYIELTKIGELIIKWGYSSVG